MEKLEKRGTEESREQYINRIYSSKIENGFTNRDCADIINSELNTNFQESYLRGISTNYSKGFSDGFEKALSDKSGKNRLSEIREELGELFVTKQSVKNDINKLGRIKREFVKSIDISEDIKTALLKEFDNDLYFSSPRQIMDTEGGSKLVIMLSDWHIGYVIKDYRGNNYNFKIAMDKLDTLVEEIIKVCKKRNISEVYVLNLGDVIEHTNMRINQSFDCEFSLSEQIAKASKLLLDFCMALTSNELFVNLITVGGNHSRMNGNKDGNIEGDNANVIIYENIKTILDISESKGVNLNINLVPVDFKDDSSEININGLEVLAIHGDNRLADARRLYETEKAKLILRGHYHGFSAQMFGDGGYVITNGCLFGFNPYSKKRMGCETYASQSFVIVDEFGEIDSIKNVIL